MRPEGALIVQASNEVWLAHTTVLYRCHLGHVAKWPLLQGVAHLVFTMSHLVSWLVLKVPHLGCREAEASVTDHEGSFGCVAEELVAPILYDEVLHQSPTAQALHASTGWLPIVVHKHVPKWALVVKPQGGQVPCNARDTRALVGKVPVQGAGCSRTERTD